MTTINALVQKKTKGAEVPKVVSKTYINYENKIDICRRIVRATMVKQVGDAEIFCVDTPAQYYQFNLVLIQEYTDVYMGGSPTEMLKNYNILNKHGLVAELIKQIPESEYSEFRVILDMCVNDYMENNRSITSLLETKFAALQAVLSGMNREFAERVKEEIQK